MKILFTILIVGLTITLKAQIPVNFDDCGSDMFFATAEQMPKWNNKSKTLEQFLENEFKVLKNIEKANGEIIIGIIVDEDGSVCCKSIINTTITELDTKTIKNIIDKMPKWKPAIQNSKSIIFLHHLIIKMKDGKITIK